MRPIAIVNCLVYTPEEQWASGLVLIQGRTLRAVGPSSSISLPSNTQLLDAGGGLVTPGLIDLARPATGSDKKPEAMGVTSYLTWVEVCTERDLALLEAAARRAQPSSGARALGLHVRGSWLSGCEEAISWRAVWAVAGDAIRLCTVAPEGEAGVITALQGMGVGLVAAEPAGKEVPDEFWAGGGLARWGVSGADAGAHEHFQLIPFSSLSTLPPTLLSQQESWCCLVSSEDALLSAPAMRAAAQATGIDFSTLLTSVTRAPAACLGLNCGRLAPSAPADLVGWTRFGEVAWTMVGGRILFPRKAVGVWRQPAEGVAPAVFATARSQALDRIITFLQQRPDTVEVQYVAADPGYRRQGIDLLWRFREGKAKEARVSIRVCAQDSGDESVLFLQFAQAGHPDSEPRVLSTRAQWLFCVWTTGRHLLCLPVRALRAWFEERGRRLQKTKRGARPGWLAPVDALLKALPQARWVPLDAITGPGRSSSSRQEGWG